MSEKKEYVKLWLSYETYFRSYTPEDIGRLVLAMLACKDTGKEPVFQVDTLKGTICETGVTGTAKTLFCEHVVE